MTPEHLQQIKERAEKASPGEWQSHLYTSSPNRPAEEFYAIWSAPRSDFYPNDDNRPVVWDKQFLTGGDAEFISHAHQDIPALLAEVERLTAESTDEYSGLTKALAVIEKHLPNTEDLYRELSAFQRSICK